jgi:catechol 2,3-dioxygenase-like lactoylglutathione lyase family enzyme
MIIVKDVAASSRWYREVLGLTSGHGGDEFEMLMADQDLVVMLHDLGYAEHPSIEDPRDGGPGRGVLLYFSTDDVQPYFERAKARAAKLIDEPHLNPASGSIEFSLRDPDGYALTVSQWAG